MELLKTEDLPPHLRLLVENLREVDRLGEIHTEIGGEERGRRSGLGVLNKSAIVLLVACWESYVEEAGKQTFTFTIRRAKDFSAFSNKVLALAGKELRDNQDATAIWKLAGSGWKSILRKHSSQILRKHVGPFHTPNTKNINRFFEELLGIRSVSSSWKWTGMSRTSAERKLDNLVSLRHRIAHQVETDTPVRKASVENYSHFIARLAGVTSNSLRRFVEEAVDKEPWVHVRYMGSILKKTTKKEKK